MDYLRAARGVGLMKPYKVGPGKPPLETRFKPGNQEWKKREEKRKALSAFSPASDVLAVLGSPIRVKKNGVIIEQVRLQVIVDSMVADALRGDIGAADALIGLKLNAEPNDGLQKMTIIFDEPGDADL